MEKNNSFATKVFFFLLEISFEFVEIIIETYKFFGSLLIKKKFQTEKLELQIFE